MSSASKLYYNKKPSQLQIFKTLDLIYKNGRNLTKINIDLIKFIAVGDYIKVIKDYENIFQVYDILKQEQSTTFFAITKLKNSPYKAILLLKVGLICNLNNKRFQQLMFVLKEMLYFSFQKSTETNIAAAWGLELVNMYNRCCTFAKTQHVNGFNSNICSNTYPYLLLPQYNFKFGGVLQLLSQTRIKINILEILLELLRLDCDKNGFKMKTDSSSSILEILNILRQKLVSENDFFKTSNYADDELNEAVDRAGTGTTLNSNKGKLNFWKNNVSNFFYKETVYITNIINGCHKVVLSIFGEKQNYNFLLNDAIKTVWIYISSMLDNAMLWWIETPTSCYSIFHVDAIRNSINSENTKEIQHPAYLSIKAFCESLTIFASNNVWDKMFRLTLVTLSDAKNVDKYKKKEREYMEMGTCVAKCWNIMFNNLKIFNNFLLALEGPTCQVPVAEQILILHRIDHSIHSMRIWINEQCKLKSTQWIIGAVFQLLNYDLLQCLKTLSLIDFRKLSIKNADTLMTVCISLRAKLIFEINCNISKLKNTSEVCISIMSSVCRTLSFAICSLSFPSRPHWQQEKVRENKSAYVSFILDQIFLPALNATKDMYILELILKLICEAWIDYIYSQRIKFSTAGALALVDDFDEVRDWISKLPNMSHFSMMKLVNHEVLHMCKGVGKVLARKPKEIITIVHSPNHQNATPKEQSRETKLPSEMFVSNQSSWLQLRASSGNLAIFCCTSIHD